MGDRREADVRLPFFQGIQPIDRARIPKDILAGVTLAAMSIPQVLGYTKIAGMPVVTGLYTLLLPLLAFAIFGSSRYLVVAADSATAAILGAGLAGMAATGSPRYAALAGLLAVITGGCLMLAWLLKLGFMAEFLSQTVLVGFLTGVGFQVGIAVLGQMLGVEVKSHKTIQQVGEILAGLPQANPAVLWISLAVVACILILRHFVPRFPGALVVVVVAIAASWRFDFGAHGIAVIGQVSGGLPPFGLHGIGGRDIWGLMPVAGSCFVMIVTQSAATARAYAVRHDQALDENRDLGALFVANVAAGLSGAFVVNGSPTQTTMVERSGGQSQIAHLTTAGMVALVLLFLTAPLKFLPQCVLGSVVFTIAIGLIDWRNLHGIRRESLGEFWLAVATAASVVLIGVEQGMLLAMALSLLRIVHHSYHPHTAVLVLAGKGEWRLTPAVPGAVTEPGLVIYRFGAPLFYYNANRFSEEALGLASAENAAVHCLVVDAGPITNVDYTAARNVLQLKKDLDRRGVLLAFAHVQSDLRADLDRHRLTAVIGEDRLFETLHEALAVLRAQRILRGAG